MAGRKNKLSRSPLFRRRGCRAVESELRVPAAQLAVEAGVGAKQAQE